MDLSPTMIAVIFAVVFAAAGPAAASNGSTPSSTTPSIATSDVPTPQATAALIAKLGNSEYAVRQEAQEKLAKLGADAFDALVAAQDNDDLEIAARARYLVHLIRIDWIHDTDSPLVKDLLTDYDSKSPTDRLQVIVHLTQLPRGEAMEALCRLVRFEMSPVLAKRVALFLMAPPEPSQKAWPQQAKQIMRYLGGSDRVPARWLRNYVRAHDDPEGAIAELDKLVADELKVNDPADQQGETLVQSALMQRYAETLMAHHHRDQAIAVMRKMIGRVNDNVDSLVAFVDWLVEQKAWEVVDETARQFNATFSADRTLLYAEAQSHQARGDALSAEKFADQAFKIVSAESDDLLARYTVARRLYLLGMVPWCEREYRRIVDTDPADSKEVVSSRRILAELFHDQNRDAEAAAIIGTMLDQMQKNGDFAQKVAGDYRMRPGAIRAEYHYYLACQARAKGDIPRETEELDAALEKGDPGDPNPDVLIGLYRLPDQTAARHKQTLELIHRAIQSYTNAIGSYEASLTADADSDDERILYNEYAWLVANTEGDLDRATDYAKKAVDMAPDDGEVLDTLGHCYAAKKDFENAVKTQARAVELDPGSMQIRLALEDFRKAGEQAKHAAAPKQPRP